MREIAPGPHTPLPWAQLPGTAMIWRAQDVEQHQRAGDVLPDAVLIHDGLSCARGIADAALIVAAVNAHAHLIEVLTLILPMAKGYAAAHPVGNNAVIIEMGEAVLGNAPVAVAP